ncbi:conserved exported protein of unknown function [Rhodovastum atsumiense]|uniref:hypothetical protein n=1 Tax=Rhodovastum atsumiense TaxID=504468 RepID=UPI00139F2B4D|nr:hypothetical protein [Rhodovastum atsumiense]CAH2603238.1 conserved exported protein of unknown function [Rhodovastum atsumiense]
MAPLPMMMTLLMTVALGPALAGCAARQAREARDWAAGRSLAELESCMGVPDRTDRQPDGVVIAQWDRAEAASSMTLPLLDLALLPVTLPVTLAGAGSVSVGAVASCRVIATVRGGRVDGLRYAGDSDGVGGRDAACAPLVRGCVRGP